LKITVEVGEYHCLRKIRFLLDFCRLFTVEHSKKDLTFDPGPKNVSISSLVSVAARIGYLRYTNTEQFLQNAFVYGSRINKVRERAGPKSRTNIGDRNDDENHDNFKFAIAFPLESPNKHDTRLNAINYYTVYLHDVY